MRAIVPRDASDVIALPESPAVRLDGISKCFGATVAVAEISLQVFPATVFGIVGPNGAGKSTTIGCMLGLLIPDGGAVEILGTDPSKDRIGVFRRVGVKLQGDQGIYSRLRVQEAVDLYASFFADPVPPPELLEEFGLLGKADSFFRELSGGQRVRLLVALSLVGRPELLVLDEPTTGLDPQSRNNLWDTLQAARSKGTTIVFTTHYLEEAEDQCDVVSVIDEGVVIAQGPPRTLLADAQLELRVTVPARSGESRAELEALPMSSQVECVRDRVHVYGRGDDLVSEVAAVAARYGVRRTEIETRPARLEDLYILKTGREYRVES